MKIKEIKSSKPIKDDTIYIVSLVPNWLEKLFGVKPKVKEYKDTGYVYLLGGNREYIDKNGKSLGNMNSIGEAIDEWRRSW